MSKFKNILIVVVVLNMVNCTPPQKDIWTGVIYKNNNIEMRMIAHLFGRPGFYLFMNEAEESFCNRNQVSHLEGNLLISLGNDSGIVVKISPVDMERSFESRVVYPNERCKPGSGIFLGCIYYLKNDAEFTSGAILPSLNGIFCSMKATISTANGDTLEINIKDTQLQKGEWWGNVPGPIPMRPKSCLFGRWTEENSSRK